MTITAFIPARYNSSRLPGKPLAIIGKKPMIQWVYEAALKNKAINEVVVLTDDERIFHSVRGFNGKAVMTSSEARNGTDRISEVINAFHSDIILNLQGDEPGITQSMLDGLISLIIRKDVEVATLTARINNPDVLFDPNLVKVVFNTNMEAMYFSRQAIPAHRDKSYSEWHKLSAYYSHVGLYAFKKDTFNKLMNLKPSRLELTESLEQLRWLEGGFKIHLSEIENDQVSGIDTPADLKKARAIYQDYYGR